LNSGAGPGRRSVATRTWDHICATSSTPGCCRTASILPNKPNITGRNGGRCLISHIGLDTISLWILCSPGCATRGHQKISVAGLPTISPTTPARGRQKTLCAGISGPGRRERRLRQYLPRGNRNRRKRTSRKSHCDRIRWSQRPV